MIRASLDPKIAARISKNIRALRKQRGLTQLDLNKKTGVPQAVLSHIENGRIKNPSLSFVLRTAKALGVTPSELTGLRL
jgi:transcriptional regulator with XRE-family HTH domain